MSMKSQSSIYTILLLLLLTALVSCVRAQRPYTPLDEARKNVEQISESATINRLVPLELQQARERLEQAETAWKNREEQAYLDHYVYLTNRQVDITRETARLRQMEARVDELRSERERARIEARAQQAEAKRQQAEARRQAAEQRTEELERQTREMEEQAKRLQTAVAELEARPTERGLILTLGSDVLFDFDRYELKPGAKRTIERVADFLNEYPERKVLIEGFTDAVGSREYNMGLSERRANAVRMALLERGVDPDRIKIRGYGPDHPVASNDTEAGRQRNRRVEIVVSDDEGEIPERTVRRTHR
jgi:outer membrane protein OmpA-like peptidoglycan-associated protein